MARLSYPAVIEARESMDKTKRQFSAEFLIEPSDLTNFKLKQDDGSYEVVDIRKLCAEVAREEWGEDLDVDTLKNVDPDKGGLGWPLKNGNDYAAAREANGKKGDAYKGQVYIRTKAAETIVPQLQTLVPGEKRFQTLDRTSDLAVINDYFTAGNYVLGMLTVKAVETPAKKKFVTVYLNGVVYLKKGEPLGTGGTMLDDRHFDDLVGGISDLDPTEGMDDSIAL